MKRYLLPLILTAFVSSQALAQSEYTIVTDSAQKENVPVTDSLTEAAAPRPMKQDSLSGLITITKAEVLEQHDMKAFDSSIPAGNYSGLTWIEGDRYALVSDKQTADGWYEVKIDLNQQTGDISSMKLVAFHSQKKQSTAVRDAEGIVYNPDSKTVFISAENDQKVLEYDMKGQPTGRSLSIPKEMGVDKIFGNYGFEALGYSRENKTYWTTTEQALKADANDASSYTNKVPDRLRLVSFSKDLQFKGQWPYMTDVPTVSAKPRLYAFGVPEVTALKDGSLLVLEREFYVANLYTGSYVMNKIYQVRPTDRNQCSFGTSLKKLSKDDFLPKTAVAEWKTNLRVGLFQFTNTIANYEGMCLAPTLPDGRIPVLLVNDSQGNYGNSIVSLGDYIKVVLLTTK